MYKLEVNIVNAHQFLAATVTNKPKNKYSDMKIDKTTYKDRKERPIEMTANHTSRPDKVLFFADPHFLFFKSRPTLHTLPSRSKQQHKPELAKEYIRPNTRTPANRARAYNIV